MGWEPVVDALCKLPQKRQQLVEALSALLIGQGPGWYRVLNQQMLAFVRYFLCQYFPDPSECVWASNFRHITAQQSGTRPNVVKVLIFNQINMLFEEPFAVSSVQVSLKDECQVYRISLPLVRATCP